MKREEKEKARLMRKEGKAIGEIAAALGVSKASVSLWVRDIKLSRAQQSSLNARGFSVAAIEQRRVKRIEATQIRHKAIIDEAKRQIYNPSRHELLLIGTALYLGEGTKASKGAAAVTSSDPGIIRIMMRFFVEVCEVPGRKFRGHVHTFSHLNVKAAERYWSQVSGIPLSQFYKTYAKQSKASLSKRDSLPYGTFCIHVNDTQVQLRIRGWMDGLREFAS